MNGRSQKKFPGDRYQVGLDKKVLFKTQSHKRLQNCLHFNEARPITEEVPRPHKFLHKVGLFHQSLGFNNTMLRERKNVYQT